MRSVRFATVAAACCLVVAPASPAAAKDDLGYKPVRLRVTPATPTVKDALKVSFRAPYGATGRRWWAARVTVTDCSDQAEAVPEAQAVRVYVPAPRRKGAKVTIVAAPQDQPGRTLPYSQTPWPASTVADRWCLGTAQVSIEFAARKGSSGRTVWLQGGGAGVSRMIRMNVGLSPAP